MAEAGGDSLIYRQATLKNQAEDVISGNEPTETDVPILAVIPRFASRPSAGAVALFGDSNCLDSARAQKGMLLRFQEQKESLAKNCRFRMMKMTALQTFCKK